jgi:PDDEXK-like uncharacterized protein DUF3799
MTTLTVTEPGIYLDMPAEAYHGTPTPTFALSAGFAMTMEDESPAAAWYGSPLNPGFVAETKRVFDIGSAAHLILLEGDRWQGRVELIDAEDFRTKAAQEARDRAYRLGMLPLLPKDVALVTNMRGAFHNALPGLPFATAPDYAARGLAGGDAEVSVFARDEAHSIWLKCRPDYVRGGDKVDTLVDYKTMALGGMDLDRYAAKQGWHRRAAWYTDVYRRATGRDAEYIFLGQSKDPPHFVTCAKMDARALEWGQRLNERAKRQFAECMASGRWPSNVGAPVVLSLPHWEDVRLQDLEAGGHFKGRAPLDQVAAKAVQEGYAP